MAVFKVQKTKNYTVMSNYHLRDKNLSLKAKGLLSIMLSLPDEWEYSVSGLVSICKESKTAIQSTLKELEQTGYLVRNKTINEKGQFDYEYIIFENNFDNVRETETPFMDKPCMDNLCTGNACTENVPQLNTNISNTKELITYKLNINQSILRDDVENLISSDSFGLQDKKRLDEIINIILEIFNSRKEYMTISGNKIEMHDVKNMFANLECDHIQYVLGCLDNCTSNIKNIKSYLTTCLYNSLLTINNYYNQRFNYEMGGR